MVSALGNLSLFGPRVRTGAHTDFDASGDGERSISGARVARLTVGRFIGAKLGSSGARHAGSIWLSFGTCCWETKSTICGPSWGPNCARISVLDGSTLPRMTGRAAAAGRGSLRGGITGLEGPNSGDACMN